MKKQVIENIQITHEMTERKFWSHFFFSFALCVVLYSNYWHPIVSDNMGIVYSRMTTIVYM